MTIADLEGYYRRGAQRDRALAVLRLRRVVRQPRGIDHCGDREQRPAAAEQPGVERATRAVDGVLRKVRERDAEQPATYRLWKQE